MDRIGLIVCGLEVFWDRSVAKQNYKAPLRPEELPQGSCNPIMETRCFRYSLEELRDGKVKMRHGGQVKLLMSKYVNVV